MFLSIYDAENSKKYFFEQKKNCYFRRVNPPGHIDSGRVHRLCMLDEQLVATLLLRKLDPQ